MTIDKNAKIGTAEDIIFIHKYIELTLSSQFIDKKEEKFLKELDTMVENNLMVHHTRDCQVIETGNHYVSLAFKIKKDDYIYSLIFTAKFKQDFDSQPIGSNTIIIKCLIDRISKLNDKECQKFKDHHKIVSMIGIDKDTFSYQALICSKEIDINENIITQLPCAYMISENHILKPKLQPDACVVS